MKPITLEDAATALEAAFLSGDEVRVDLEKQPARRLPSGAAGRYPQSRCRPHNG